MAHGLAGQGMIRLWEPEVLESQRRWLAAAVAGGRRVVVEPWLERIADFSVHFEAQADRLQTRGYAGLSNDARGQYESNWVGGDHGRKPPAPILEALRTVGVVPSELVTLYEELRQELETELQVRRYLGPVGVDALVYRDSNGQVRLKPVVEINPRYTMGRLTLELMARVGPGSAARFRLVRAAQVKAEGQDDFASYARMLAERSPLHLEGQPIARIREGTVVLNDPGQATGYLAILEVSRKAPPNWGSI